MNELFLEKRRLAPFLAIACALSILPTAALANDVTVGGVLGLTNARVDSQNPLEADGLTTSRKLGVGASVTLGFHEAADPLGLQIGAWYLHRKFEIDDSSLRVVRTVPTLLVPVELKFFPTGILSVSGGGFAAFRIGDATDEVQLGNTSLFSFSSAQRKSTEFGLTLAAEAEIPVAPMTGFIAEARYWRGLSNSADNSVFNEKIDDLTLMLGLRFGM